MKLLGLADWLKQSISDSQANRFESLPHGALPNRRNMVLTTEWGAHFNNCLVYNTLWGALMDTKEEEEVFCLIFPRHV